MDDGFGEFGLEYCEVRNVFLVGLDFAEGGDVVDDAVDPHSLDVGNVVALDLVGDVVAVSLVDLLLPQDLRLQLLLIPVR